MDQEYSWNEIKERPGYYKVDNKYIFLSQHNNIWYITENKVSNANKEKWQDKKFIEMLSADLF